MASGTQQQQQHVAACVRKARLLMEHDSPQRAGLLEPRLLRAWLPGRCQAIHARHDDSSGPGSQGHAVHRARVVNVLRNGDVVTGVEAEALIADVRGTTGQKITVRASRTILQAARSTRPAVLLRSNAPDPHERHREAHVLAPDDAHHGNLRRTRSTRSTARRSRSTPTTSSGRTLTRVRSGSSSGCPLQPAFAAGFYRPLGEESPSSMDQLWHTQCMIALMRDGFHEDSQGGAVDSTTKGSLLSTIRSTTT